VAMQRPIVKMDSAGSRALLQSVEVRADLMGRAEKIAARAGAGFEAKVVVGRKRAMASISAATPDAARAEATDRVLLKALDAGR